MKAIIIHCSDSPHGRGDDAAAIHRWHTERGWDGIGYHYVITETGELQRGRPHYWSGAHVRGHNYDTLGVCLIGRDGSEFTAAQWRALLRLMLDLTEQYPEAKVRGHRDYDDSKTCPGFDASDWWSTVMQQQLTGDDS